MVRYGFGGTNIARTLIWPLTKCGIAHRSTCILKRTLRIRLVKKKWSRGIRTTRVRGSCAYLIYFIISRRPT